MNKNDNKMITKIAEVIAETAMRSEHLSPFVKK